MKIISIFQECEIALKEAIRILYENRPNYFLLFLSRAEYFPQGEHITGFSPYLIDYIPDMYNNFYQRKYVVDYLRRNYSKEGFSYQGEKDVNDLITEMLIYSHIWEDVGFLKLLLRLSELLDQKDYAWSIEEIDYHNNLSKIVNERIIQSLRNQELKLYKMIEKAYSNHIRDAFAHSMYSIDFENRRMHIWGGRTIEKKWEETISFDAFQEKFLITIKIWNLLFGLVDDYRMCVAKEGWRCEIVLPASKTLYLNAEIHKYRGEASFYGIVLKTDNK